MAPSKEGLRQRKAGSTPARGDREKRVEPLDGEETARGPHGARAALSAWVHSLFDPIPIHSIVFLRIFWGIVMAYEMWTYTEGDYEKAYVALVQPKYMFKYWAFEWVPRMGFAAWQLFFRCMLLFSFMFSIGFLYHFAALAYFVGFTFLYLQDMSFYLNHFYLIIVLCFAYIFLPANRYFSVDAALGLVERRNTAPRWTLVLVQFLISNVYVWAGIAKMNEDWIRGEPLLHWLPRRGDAFAPLQPLLELPLTAYLMSWAGLLFDTFVPFFCYAGGYYRWLAFAASIVFHVTNKLVFNIGVFPYVMIVLTFLYFDPDWPLQLQQACVNFVGLRDGSSARAAAKRNAPDASAASARAPSASSGARRAGALSASQWLTLALLAVFALQQLLFPLRHLLYPGDVTWNEEGHRYSWRMKLRDKAGMTKFFVVHQNASQHEVTTLVDTRDFLSGRQLRKMAGRPEMIHLFADHVADVYEARLGKRPRVHALVIGSVNFRVPQFMVDPRVDLAAIEPWSWPNEWVVDMLPLGVTEHLMIPSALAKESDDIFSKNRLFRMYGHVELADALRYFEEYDKLKKKHATA